MKLKVISYLVVLISQVICTEPVVNSEKPLHIGVSITFATRSHIKYILEILEDVSKRGHRITFLCMDEMRRFGNGYNLTYYSLGDVKMTGNELGITKPYMRGDALLTNVNGMREDIYNLYKVSFPVYEKFYREEKPDLMVCDFGANSCVESAAKNAMPMVIGYQSLMFSYQDKFLTGNGAMDPTTIETYSFLQRMKHAFYDPVAFFLNALPVIDLVQKEREIQGIPPVYRFPILGYMGIGIANSYIGLESPRNLPSHIYPIGPILSGDAPLLSEDIQNFMDSHEKVIYIAFGSMVNLPKDMVSKILQHVQKAINEELLDGVIWGMPKNDKKSFPKSYKVENIEYSTVQIIEGTHDKIKLLKWAPQQSILSHESTKLFLSHGGLDSTYESMNAGVPMLVLPFIADQPRNAMLIAENGVGDAIEWKAMTDGQVYQKLAKLLDPSNLELKSKVRQMQLITKFSSKRKLMAADLIETYAYSAKSCRQFSTPKPFESPCEVLPFLPLDKRISYIKANLIDVYIVGVLIALVTLYSIVYITYYSSKSLIMILKRKTKQE